MAVVKGHDPARIRAIVEGTFGKHICPLCHYSNFTGAMHAYAGNRGPSKNTTRWCSGKHVVEPKDGAETHEFQCPECSQVWFYTQSELNINVNECHECADKTRSFENV